MTSYKFLQANGDYQKGIVLVTGLFFLLILTLIGVHAMSSSALTEKMTQNSRDMNIAFVSGETALSDGEKWLQRQFVVPTPVETCNTPPCTVWKYNILGSLYTETDSWWFTQGTPFSSTLKGTSAQPRFLIEQHSFRPYELSPEAAAKGQGYYYYRITSRGLGKTDKAHVTLQSIYEIQFN